MSTGFFITGTDTDVGKTAIALGLMVALQKNGLKVAAMKPVSAGCVKTSDGLHNDDAVLLQKQSSVEISYELVNPYAFEAAIAPHIAAEQLGVEMQKDSLLTALEEIKQQSDVVIVEGAGGWMVPFNESETMADVAVSFNLPIILIVGMRLGCLNHALLTQSMIRKKGLVLAGWIANYIIPDFACTSENESTLVKWLDAPLLGTIPHTKDLNSETVSDHLEINKLMVK